MERLIRQIRELYAQELQPAPFLSGIRLGSLAVKVREGEMRVFGEASLGMFGLDFLETEKIRECTPPSRISATENVIESIKSTGSIDTGTNLPIEGAVEITYGFTDTKSFIFKSPDCTFERILYAKYYCGIISRESVVQSEFQEALRQVTKRGWWRQDDHLYIAVKIVRCANGLISQQRDHRTYKSASLKIQVLKEAHLPGFEISVIAQNELSVNCEVKSGFVIGVVWYKVNPNLPLTIAERNDIKMFLERMRRLGLIPRAVTLNIEVESPSSARGGFYGGSYPSVAVPLSLKRTYAEEDLWTQKAPTSTQREDDQKHARAPSYQTLIEMDEMYGEKYNVGVASEPVTAVGFLNFEEEACKNALTRLLDADGPEAVAEGCLAVAQLCGVRWRATLELGRLGACEPVVKALKTFGAANAKVARFGCDAVIQLSKHEDNKRQLGHIGACDAVIEVLKAFGTVDVNVARAGCRAVYHLSEGDSPNIHDLGRAGGCGTMLNVLTTFGVTDDVVAAWGCAAITNLALQKINRIQLIRLGGQDIVTCSVDTWAKLEALESVSLSPSAPYDRDLVRQGYTQGEDWRRWSM